MLEINEVRKDFGGLRALNCVSIEMLEGEILGLIGPNGSGKTTLLNIITGFLPVTSGTIIFKEKVLSGLSPHVIATKGIVRTFQLTSIFPNLTVADNIAVGRYLKAKSSIFGAFLQTKAYKIAEMELRRKVDEILTDFPRLREKRDVIAKNLSLGEQRNLEIVIALATEPELLLLDEPAAGLNPMETQELSNFICSLQQRGVSLLIVEHNMKLVMSLCTRIVVLDYGAKIAEGTPKEIAQNDKVISVYLGGRQESARD